jgi:hypothetical protein
VYSNRSGWSTIYKDTQASWWTGTKWEPIRAPGQVLDYTRTYTECATVETWCGAVGRHTNWFLPATGTFVGYASLIDTRDNVWLKTRTTVWFRENGSWISGYDERVFQA